MRDLECWIWLSRLNKLPVNTIRQLIEKYGTPESIWNLNEKELKKEQITIEQLEQILDKRIKKKPK